MSRKMTKYSTQFKTKIVLEILREEKTLNEIASEYNIIPKNIMNWKKIFLENTEVAMEPAKAVKEYKDEINNLNKKVDEYAKKVGQLTLEKDWAVGRPPNTSWANKQHPKYSYKLKGVDIIRANQVWSTDITYIKIKGENRLIKANCFAFIGLKPKALCFSIAVGVYMAAIIDWYSKAILSWKISNTMDTDLVMGVLNEALSKYGNPEIFNTDQGSQYTSYIHTQTLKDRGIIISMDGKGRAADNICITGKFALQPLFATFERFWRSAKVEKIYLNEYDRVSTLKDDVYDYINFYNHKRFVLVPAGLHHETLNYKKPMNVYWDSIKINDENYTKLDKNVA